MSDISQANDTALTLGPILKITIPTAVVVGFSMGVFNQAFAWIKETIQRRQEDSKSAGDLALKIVEILTHFAQKCNEQADFNEYDKDSGEGQGRYSKMPDLGPYPKGPEWGLLPRSIAAGLRDLPVEINEATGAIRATEEVTFDPGEAADHATYRFVTVGYMALTLAERLRRQYRFRAYQSAGRSNFTAELRKKYRRYRSGPFSQFWNGRFVSRMRSRLSRWWRQREKALRQILTKLRELPSQKP